MGLAALWVTTGCILPPEFEVVPDPANNPPIINPDATLIDPPTAAQDGILKWDGASGRLSFQLQDIRDADTGDTLYLRWLVGFDPDKTALNQVRTEEEIPPTNQTARRSRAFDVTVEMLDEIDIARGAGGAGRPYKVEVLLGDRRPVFGSAPQQFPPDARTARWYWVVERVAAGGGN